jgi:hypothetical protein
MYFTVSESEFGEFGSVATTGTSNKAFQGLPFQEIWASSRPSDSRRRCANDNNGQVK